MNTPSRKTAWAAIGAIGAAAALVAAPAHAQGYVGGGIGPSKIDINCSGTTSCDRTDTGFKLYGGWNVAGPWSLEAVYFDWGKASASAAAGGITSTLDTNASGLGFGGAFTYLFAWGRCYARLGIARNEADTDTAIAGVGASSSYSSTEAYYGFGCGYSFTPQWMLTADADFSRVKYTSSDKANTQLFTIGARFSF